MFLCSLKTLTAILLFLSVIQAVKSECNPKPGKKDYRNNEKFGMMYIYFSFLLHI